MRRWAGVPGLVLGMLLLPMAAGRCQEAGAPAGENRLKNADFARHEGDRPADWKFMSARLDNFVYEWSPLGNAGPGCLHLKTHTAKMSGYWYQAIPVKPGEKIRVRCRVRTSGGKILLYLTGAVQPAGRQAYNFDERAQLSSMKNFFLAPDWIKREHLRGPSLDEWVPLEKVITIPEGMTALTVHVGSYFMEGEMWVDDFFAGPAPAATK